MAVEAARDKLWVCLDCLKADEQEGKGRGQECRGEALVTRLPVFAG